MSYERTVATKWWTADAVSACHEAAVAGNRHAPVDGGTTRRRVSACRSTADSSSPAAKGSKTSISGALARTVSRHCRLIFGADVQVECLEDDRVLFDFVLADLIDPASDFFAQPRVQTPRRPGFGSEGLQRLRQVAVLLAQRLDGPLQTRLLFPHGIHLAALQ